MIYITMRLIKRRWYCLLSKRAAFNIVSSYAIQQGFDVALHGMRLNMKAVNHTPSEQIVVVAEKQKMFSCRPQTLWSQGMESIYKHTTVISLCVVYLPLAVCLSYAAWTYETCIYVRAWCSMAMVLLPLAIHQLHIRLKTHTGVLVGVGLLTLVSSTSTATKDVLCMVSLSLCSVHAYIVYSLEGASKRRHQRLVAPFMLLMLVLVSMLVSDLWGVLETRVMSAVLLAFLALYVVCLCLLKPQ